MQSGRVEVEVREATLLARIGCRTGRELLNRKLLSIVVSIAALSAIVRSGALADLSDYPAVSTIAGSGESGLVDGPSRSAQFVSPAGIAYDRRGNLYIADRAAQRIRMLSTNGTVSTIAGSGPLVAFGLGVAGGFRDGPARGAQFNYPNDVAVGPDDAIYVADTLNHVIRRIKNGIVSTFAGVPLKDGSTDGPREQMLFTYPRSLAFDRAGNLYIADFPHGVRKIDTSGIGSTIDFGDGRFKDVSSLAIVEDHDAFLVAGSAFQIFLYNLTQQKLVRYSFNSRDLSMKPDNEGAEFAGPPSAIAAFSPDEWVITDALDSTVELHQGGGNEDYVRVLNADPLRNASSLGGGYRDGPGPQALFNQPLGIVVAPDKRSIVVADTGNRRIRRLSAFDHRSGALTCCTPQKRVSVLPTRPNEREFRIALVGPSYIWWDSPWSESIPGLVERALNRDLDIKKRNLTVRVYPIRLTGVGGWNVLDYTQNVLTTGIVNQVVAAFSLYAGKLNSVHGLYDANGADGRYDQSFTQKLAAVNQELKQVGTTFLVAPYLESDHFPAETTYWRIPGTASQPIRSDRLLPDLTAAEADANNMLAVVKKAHVPYVNVADALVKDELSAHHRSIYHTWDSHFTAYGNALFARVLVNALEKLHPWRSESK